MKLDAEGYSETALRSAWSQVSNQDIAASIIGFIRQQSLGSPLVSYDQRVDRALDKVLASQRWNPPQRKWLERIGKQLKVETIVDREALDRRRRGPGPGPGPHPLHAAVFVEAQGQGEYPRPQVAGVALSWERRVASAMARTHAAQDLQILPEGGNSGTWLRPRALLARKARLL